jgi:hypothetical protein
MGNSKWSSFSQRVSQEKAKREGHLIDGTKRDPKKLVPKELWEFLDIFDEEKAKQLPKHSEWDMEIHLEDDAKPPPIRQPYKLDRVEEEVLQEFLDKHLQRGTIRIPDSKTDSNTLRTGAPIFFVGMLGL